MRHQFLLFFFCFIIINQKTFASENISSDSISGKIIFNDSILNFAKHFLGTPYQKGAKGPNRFDCSGYTGYIFSRFGYPLASSSASQYLQGEKIEMHDLQKGDLVFFKGRNAKSNSVGHVGIVYSTDTINHTFSFIHAAVQGGVRIDSYTEREYYTCRYVGAKRILPSTCFPLKEKTDFNISPDSSVVINEIIPEEKSHIVKSGETLYRIAKTYNCTVEELMHWNKLGNTKLKIGQRLKMFPTSEKI